MEIQTNPVDADVKIKVLKSPAKAPLTEEESGEVFNSNIIKVIPGTVVSYEISKVGYITQKGTLTITENMNVSFTLEKEHISQYEYVLKVYPQDGYITLRDEAGNVLRADDGQVKVIVDKNSILNYEIESPSEEYASVKGQVRVIAATTDTIYLRKSTGKSCEVTVNSCPKEAIITLSYPSIAKITNSSTKELTDITVDSSHAYWTTIKQDTELIFTYIEQEFNSYWSEYTLGDVGSDLSSFGISYTGTPKEKDTITCGFLITKTKKTTNTGTCTISTDFWVTPTVTYTVKADGYQDATGTGIVLPNVDSDITRTEYLKWTTSGVLLETSTAGVYDIEIKESYPVPKLHFIMVGAGGGGAASGYQHNRYFHSDTHRTNAGAGGSGAFLEGYMDAVAGTYTINVGNAGEGYKVIHANISGTAGADTIIKAPNNIDYIATTGGSGGFAGAEKAHSGGVGGSIEIVNDNKSFTNLVRLHEVPGNNGSSTYQHHSSNASDVTSGLPPYGIGGGAHGTCHNTTSDKWVHNGGAAYIKLVLED